MIQIQAEIAHARRALAELAEIAPLLDGDTESELLGLLKNFNAASRAIRQAASEKVKPSFRELAPRWLAAFHGHPETLRAVWRARKFGTLPVRRLGESEADHLRRILALALSEQGKKETVSLLKEAETAAKSASRPSQDHIDPHLVPNPDVNAFLRHLGLLTRPEARDLLRAQKTKFLKEVAAIRRIPFNGEADAAFIRKLHESARRFARNTAI